MKVTLLVPVWNEIDGLKAIMPRVDPSWVDEILVIDGGSTDGTLEYARARGWKVIEQTKPGITYAYEQALPHAAGDVVIAFSPDGNSVPELIPALVSKMLEGWDMVIVSRYKDGARSEDDDWVTGLGNKAFTLIINLLFGGRYTDTLVMFRAFKKGIVGEFPQGMPRAGIEPLLSIRCAKKRLRVAEIPGDEPARLGGKRKMHPFLNGLSILKLILHELIHR